MAKSIRNTRDGFHLNSRHWQDYKKGLPPLPEPLFDVCVGMVLGDASLFKVSQNSGIKFEQGYKQREFLYHLFDLLSEYTFMIEPGSRIDLHSSRKGCVKSFWFKTFSHCSFTRLYNLFYKNKRKGVCENLITDWLSARGLAYWVMCDGSLQRSKDHLIVHTQGFTRDENTILVKELNQKWGLHCKVIPHKGRYWAIQTHPTDATTLNTLLDPYLIPSMRYKLPLGLKPQQQATQGQLMT